MIPTGNVYNWIRDSLYAFCKTFATDMAIANPTYPAIGIYNFDAFSEQNTLPLNDFIGIRSLTVDLDMELATVSCLVGFSTNDDENLFRLEELTGLLLPRLLPNTRIPIYQSGTSTQQGWMVVSNGTSVSPVLRAVQRPLRFIAIRGGVSLPVQKQP